MILKDFLDLYRNNHLKVFYRTGALEVWKNSPENTCDGVILVKSQAAGLQLFKKRLRCRYFPMNIYVITEAVSQRCFVKKVFLEISQNSQVFPCEFFKIFRNTIFYRTPLLATSVIIRDKFSQNTQRSDSEPYQTFKMERSENNYWSSAVNYFCIFTYFSGTYTWKFLILKESFLSKTGTNMLMNENYIFLGTRQGEYLEL